MYTTDVATFQVQLPKSMILLTTSIILGLQIYRIIEFHLTNQDKSTIISLAGETIVYVYTMSMAITSCLTTQVTFHKHLTSHMCYDPTHLAYKTFSQRIATPGYDTPATAAYISIRSNQRQPTATCSIKQRMQHPPAYASIRQHITSTCWHTSNRKEADANGCWQEASICYGRKRMR